MHSDITPGQRWLRDAEPDLGLGETIEAGLILHRLLLTERDRRVLILVPGALIHQWLVEMRRRFHLGFALFDAPKLRVVTSEHAHSTVVKAIGMLGFGKANIQDLRECWVGGSVWKEDKVIRISVCSWATTEEDVKRSVRSFAQALKEVQAVDAPHRTV